MDTSSLLIGLTLIILCTLPIIYILNNQQKNKKKKAQIFSMYGQGKYNFKTVENHYRKLYAIDEAQKAFLFADLDQPESEATLIDLTKVSTCCAEQTTIGTDAKISLHFKSSQREDEDIVLYDSAKDKLGHAYWNENIIIAKKWQQILQDNI